MKLAAVADNLATRIAVQRLDIPGRWYVIPIEHVAYAFLGWAVRRRLVTGPSIGDAALSPQAVYVRTIKGAVFRTGFATLDALRERLDPARFIPVHRLITVNVDRIVEMDLGSNLSRVGVLAGAEVEFLPVSRRCLKSLRALIALPKRIARRLR